MSDRDPALALRRVLTEARCLAEVSLVGMCERRGIGEIATLDTDLEVYGLTGGQKLRNVFRVAG